MSPDKTRYVIGREGNVVLVNFSRDPHPPAPRFPGANGLREPSGEDMSFEPLADPSARRLC
jgi:hypothetical protein